MARCGFAARRGNWHSLERWGTGGSKLKDGDQGSRRLGIVELELSTMWMIEPEKIFADAAQDEKRRRKPHNVQKRRNRSRAQAVLDDFDQVCSTSTTMR